jgi:hypothetical protein
MHHLNKIIQKHGINETLAEEYENTYGLGLGVRTEKKKHIYTTTKDVSFSVVVQKESIYFKMRI